MREKHITIIIQHKPHQNPHYYSEYQSITASHLANFVIASLQSITRILITFSGLTLCA
jgi:hypothetical protein